MAPSASKLARGEHMSASWVLNHRLGESTTFLPTPFMPNPNGINQYGYDPTSKPPDDVLRAAFVQYSTEKNGTGLSTDEQLARLQSEFGYRIKKNKLYELRKSLVAPSKRKSTLSESERAQAVIDIKVHDLAGRWGVAQVRQRLANHGILLPRDETRTILHDHFDEEFDKRFVGSHDALDRVPLNCLGPWHQIHSDGHEKLASQALMMGDITLPIYAFKDQYSTFVPMMDVLPNVRLGTTIGHYFLDFVETYGCIALQEITDKGSEVGVMAALHARLRSEAAPEFTFDEWPPSVQVQSKKNTPIEGFWRWKRNGEGHSIKQAIFIGRDNGLFNSNNPLHVQVFNWLWPPLVQQRLDEFREYWNNHRLSTQKKKILPTGTSPRQMWLAPESLRVDAKTCSIRVNMETVRKMREELGGLEAREAAFQFVDPIFAAEADAAYVDLGCPVIALTTAWDVFLGVVDILAKSS